MLDGSKKDGAPKAAARPQKKDERTVQEVAREAFEKCLAAGDGHQPEPMSDVSRLG